MVEIQSPTAENSEETKKKKKKERTKALLQNIMVLQ